MAEQFRVPPPPATRTPSEPQEGGVGEHGPIGDGTTHAPSGIPGIGATHRPLPHWPHGLPMAEHVALGPPVVVVVLPGAVVVEVVVGTVGQTGAVVVVVLVVLVVVGLAGRMETSVSAQASTAASTAAASFRVAHPPAPSMRPSRARN